MDVNTNPVKGTKDYLPAEVVVRDYVKSLILEVYRQNGFQRIETPMIESIERLDKSDGGENLSLIFKILKRGAKLDLANQNLKENDLVDSGLRYDLTLPLARYYANNRHRLKNPFKVIQVDKVFRAEKPQKGRLREFYQCDIDVIGDESVAAEIELIYVTSEALLKLGFSNFVVRVNDRRILKNVIVSAGFDAGEVSSVCVSIDKLDKVGMDGVREELITKGFDVGAVENLVKIMADTSFGSFETLGEVCRETGVVEDLKRVVNISNELADGRYKVEYDKSLVRGMGYYTGMVFEIVVPSFGTSIAGGGRYDNMIGTFVKEQIPAVGFSIGFERITSIMLEGGMFKPEVAKTVAVIYGEDSRVADAIKKSNELKRQDYKVTIFKKATNPGKQLAYLEAEGFSYVCRLDEPGDLKPLKG